MLGRNKNGTNLILGEDRQEYIRNPAIDAPGCNEQYGADGVKGGRLDEHSDDGLVHSTRPGPGTQGVSNVPAMHDESDNDHKRKEDVERDGDGKVWNAGVRGEGIQDGIRSRGPIYEHDAHAYMGDIS